jgi:hypothetical protein
MMRPQLKCCLRRNLEALKIASFRVKSHIVRQQTTQNSAYPKHYGTRTYTALTQCRSVPLQLVTIHVCTSMVLFDAGVTASNILLPFPPSPPSNRRKIPKHNVSFSPNIPLKPASLTSSFHVTRLQKVSVSLPTHPSCTAAHTGLKSN